VGYGTISKLNSEKENTSLFGMGISWVFVGGISNLMGGTDA
jgi:hypothetical protein